MFKKIISLIVILTIALSAAFVFWATQPISSSRAYEFTINPKSGLRSSAQQIAQAGVPMMPLLFELLARLAGEQNKIKAGSYLADQGITPYALLKKLVRGDFMRFSVTVIEGWTFKQMRQAVLQNPYLLHDTATLTDQAILASLTQDYSDAEGLFFPDTYLFPKGASDMEVYRQAFHRMQTRLFTAWQQRGSDAEPLKTPYEALILASIIEKETGATEDRRMIAGVFMNRLRKGMLLQTDPTVIYGMGAAYSGNIRKRDLLTDTPYNTYIRTGLPPTPIALPGMESIDAALHPAKTEALYFVAKGDGSSAFSSNLAAHNEAVNKYILKGLK